MALNDDLNKKVPNSSVASGAGGDGASAPPSPSSKANAKDDGDIDKKLNEKNVAKHATAEVGKQLGSKVAHTLAMQGLAKMMMQGVLNVLAGVKGSLVLYRVLLVVLVVW